MQSSTTEETTGTRSGEEWWVPLLAALPPLASAAQLARLFGVSPSTVYRQWQKGELGYVPFGRQRRCAREQVREYLTTAVRGRRRTPPAA